MKKKAIYLFLLIIVTSVIIAQEAPKEANLIQIKTTDNIDDAFMKVGRLLGTEGFTIETADRTFYMIVTEIMEKQYGFLGAGRIAVKLNFQFDKTPDETIINIRGNFRETSMASTGDLSRIQNTGMNNSASKESWKFMDELARKYDNGEIIYMTEEIE